MSLKLGINECDNATYHGDKHYVSSSGLKLILEDPIQYYNKYINYEDGFKSVGSSAMDLGSYVHSLILEPEKTDDEFVVFSGIKRGEIWRQFERENLGKIILSESQASLGKTLQQSLLSNKDAVELLNGGIPEFTYCTELLGCPVKVRADKINLENNYIIDIKTTSKPLNKESLMGSIASLHYDLSAALYVDCFKQINNVESMDFYFLFVNTKDSLNAAVFKASDLLITNGRRKYTKAIKRLKELRKTGNWIEKGIQEIDIPNWAIVPGEIDE